MASPSKAVSLRFLAVVAAAAVALRWVLADEIYFRLLRIPGHDMSEGLAFFATAMHSVYLDGDLAWWMPASVVGYPQYFQAMVGPLAPTWGNVVFMAWMHLVAILGTLGVHLPEYYQYLVVNYLVLPFLAFWAFGYFCSQFLRTWQAVVLALTAYVLSGIGLWDSAWFFFQEPATLFFLLGSLLALVRRPTTYRLHVAYAAVLVQLASLNYWTVYNLPWFVILVGAHALAYRTQWQRLGRWWRLSLRLRRPERWVAGAVCVVLGAWALFLGAVMADQSGKQVRTVYTVDQALDRVQEARRFTTELFNPVLRRATEQYPITNPADRTKPPLVNSVHHARYVGIVVLPLALVALVAPWSRRTRWMLVAALGALAVSLATPVAVAAWIAIPFMDRIQHVFYFYSHYWQLALVLLAAIGLDQVLAGKREREVRWIVRIAWAAAALIALALFIGSHEFKANDPTLEALVLTAGFLGLSALFLSRWSHPHGEKERRLAATGLLLFLLLDLSRYFYQVSRADMEFMLRRGFDGVVPSEAARAAFRSPWREPDPSKGFGAGIASNMPLRNDFWPVNTFMLPAAIARERLTAVLNAGAVGQPFEFDRGDRDFAYRWIHWGYNGYEVEVKAPAAGTVFIRQLFDSRWRFTVDGREVEGRGTDRPGTELQVEAGPHVIRADYKPLARRFYLPLAAMLEIACIALLARRFRPRRPRP